MAEVNDDRREYLRDVSTMRAEDDEKHYRIDHALPSRLTLFTLRRLLDDLDVHLRVERCPDGWTVTDDNRYDGPDSPYLVTAERIDEAVDELLARVKDGLTMGGLRAGSGGGEVNPIRQGA